MNTQNISDEQRTNADRRLASMQAQRIVKQYLAAEYENNADVHAALVPAMNGDIAVVEALANCVKSLLVMKVNHVA